MFNAEWVEFAVERAQIQTGSIDASFSLNFIFLAGTKCSEFICLLCIRGEPNMLKNLPIMLCCTAPESTHYAQQMLLLCSNFAH